MVKFQLHGREVTFLVDDPKGAYACLGRGKFYESEFLEYIRSLDRRGIYLDVGTNIGNHMLYFAMFCPSTRVIGFEPMDRWRALAEQHVRVNGIADKTLIHPVGLSDQNEFINFKPYGTEYRLDCRKLDDLMPELDEVSVVKMDIEGSEPKAILGARETLLRNRPLLFAEAATSVERDRLFAAAESVGYRASGRVFNATPTYELVAG